jgi:type IV pilus assembly protein PilC
MALAMLFSSRLPLSTLIELCRVLRVSLDAGMPLVKVMRQQAERGPARLRPVAQQISQALDQGTSLEDALARHQAAFPPLFLAMASVGEKTGGMAEVFGELDKYFQLQQKLRRQFITQSTRPALQFFAAVGVIAFLIWILGVIADRSGTPALDPLGLGLTGASGALIFLAFVFGILGALVALFVIVARTERKATMDALLLRVPAIGPCLRALAMGRFCLGLRLTLGNGMPIIDALGLSLRSTGNAAFAACATSVQSTLRAGNDLTLALAQTDLFPADFQNVLAVAEESGKIEETMRRQATHYQEEAERRMTFLTRAAAFLVWLLVAVLIAVAIFRIFINVYLGQLNAI